MSKTAHIIALEAASISSWLGQGFALKTFDIGTYNKFLSGVADAIWIGPRQKLEQDLGFWQPIPYIVVRNKDKYLTNIRSSAGGEARLHNKMSIGFGGHVDASDAIINPANGMINLLVTLTHAAKRELEEELSIPAEDCSRLTLRWTHIIHTAATPVDAVHIGFVAEVDLAQAAIELDLSNLENTVSTPQWLTWDEIRDKANLINKDAAEPETWTRLLLEAKRA